MRLSVGPGMNNFLVEWNENREAEIEAEANANIESTESSTDAPSEEISAS
jgi:segregation and condensation protein A